MFWYWIILILGLVFKNDGVVYLSFILMGLRIMHGLAMRLLTHNGIVLTDIITPLFFDLFATFYLLFSFKSNDVTWRGIKYEVKKGGFIEGSEYSAEILEEEHAES